MCGIVGYIGAKQATEVVLNGLRRLEYRGYDSAGIAVVAEDSLTIRKRKGKVSDFARDFAESPISGSLGIGHTRWATHGHPSDENAHPHSNTSGEFALVHNGIIENYASLRDHLISKGYVFRSETDTEALVHLIDDVRRESGLSLEEAVCQALTRVVGTYGLAIISAADPDLLIAARNGSPLILGIGDGEYIVASDAAPLVGHTRQAVYINDGEIVIARRGGYEVRTLNQVRLEKEVCALEWSLAEIEKGGYDHFMLKEIMEQPDALEACMRGRIVLANNTLRLGGLDGVLESVRNADRIIIAACGTSWHAALVGEYLIEQFARIPVEVEYASEFRYREPILRSGDVVIVISQSGETADTLAAVREAKAKNIPVLGVCNTVGSTVARETDAGIYLHIGPEIGVASTKAFSAQVLVFAMLALKLGEGRTLTEAEIACSLRAIKEIPQQVRQVLGQNEAVKEIADAYKRASNFLYLGRGYNFPVALEGALKLKEISYIHAEGYPAAEMKHGPIALIDRSMPVVFIAMKDRTYDKIISNIEEVVARRGSVIAITDRGNGELDRLCEHVIHIPPTEEYLSPLLTVIPLQLLSYHIAVARGCHVDQPRNLAKSVTVE